MSKANSKKRNILPDPEELMKLKRKRTETEHAFDECCRKVRSYELDATSTFCKRNEDQCIAWLILKDGFNVVTTVARIHTALSESLTQHQRLRMIEILSGNIASRDVISEILSFAERACPTLFEIIVPTSTNCVLVLAPPVGECCECGQRLVQYHNCKAKLYTLTGVKEVEKVVIH